MSDDDKYDAFGRPLDHDEADQARFLPPSEAAPPEASPAPTEQTAAQVGGFLPPTEQPPERDSWWAEPAPPPPSGPSGHAAPGGPVTADSAGVPADYMNRVGAAVLDFFIRLAIILPPTLLGAIGGEAGVYVGLAIGFIASQAYAPWMIATRNGQTVGHRVADIRVVRSNGQAVSGGTAFVREVLVKFILFEQVLAWLSFAIAPLLNYLWPLWDDRNEALHDKMCNTRVVKA